MSKKLLLASLISMLLAGCNQESIEIGGSGPGTGPDTGPGGGTPEVKYKGILSLDEVNVFGQSVKCNDQAASGFEFVVSDDITCYVDDLLLATYPSGTIKLAAKTLDTKYLQLIFADEYKNDLTRKTNIRTLIQNMAVTRHNQIDFDLSLLEFARFEQLLKKIDVESEEFEKIVINETSGSLVGKVPSTHIPNIKPEITVSDEPGFISVNAEESLRYTPKETIITKAVLQNSSGNPVEGIAYFSASGNGKTNDLGEFEFVWGEAVSFGIDTFELGSVRGNKTVFKLTDLGEEQRGRNVEALIQRYDDGLSAHLKVSDKTEAVFSLYPNVINEIISLSLNDENVELNVGGSTDGKPNTVTIPAEFKKQFSLGQAFEIDQAICGKSCDASVFNQFNNARNVASEMGTIQADINKLWGVDKNWAPVDRFHVFHDSTNFYGSTGSARGQAAVNIANTAFPVMMARNDNNYWLKFGDKKAWDEKGLAYITEAPSKVTPDNVGASTATFNLPFVSIGEIGKGKVMIMGNARYNSVLVCPNGYSWNGSVNAERQCGITTDSDDMTHFFQNTLRYLTNKTVAENITVGTNIPHVYFKRHGQVIGNSAPYKLAPVFNATTEQLSTFDNIDPESIPLLLINAYEYSGNGVGAYGLPMGADVNKPKLTIEDITALIEYVTKGGSVLVMETISGNNNIGPIARLFDSAGLAFGMNNSVVSNGNGLSGGYPDRVRSHREYGSWVIERYAAVSEGAGAAPKLPYTINADGSVVWDFILNNKPDDKPNLEVVSWNEVNDKGEIEKQVAFINEADHFEKNDKNEWSTDSNGEPVINQISLNAAKNRILEQFKVNGKFSYQECTNSAYHYEINCLEYRPGNGIPLTGGMYVPAYTELNLGDAEAKAMVKAANLGSNIESLYQHERYFRTEGVEGERLNSVDLNRIYQNMTVWLWNNLDYRYESAAEDELGFERFTQFLNCYTNDTAQGNTTCPDDLKATLDRLNMVYGSDNGSYAGQMNPSYPLNYMEKPLTRLMLGRSFWDYDIKVDIRQFPGEAFGSKGGDTLTLDMGNYSAAWYAGNRQPTGQWAVAHQQFTASVSGNDQPVTFSIALHDDLTGRDKHELSLKRPPRMTKSFTLDSGSNTFTVPYGGLIYVQGGGSKNVTITLSNTVDAPFYDVKKNGWVNSIDSPAPIGEVVSNSFVYTAAKSNLNAERYKGKLDVFANELDMFSADLNDFYARDEGVLGSKNRKVTDVTMPNNRHHFVNDVAISIGAAHSGYPVMNDSFNVQGRNLSTTPLNDWLLWHEVGHNAAEAPFNVAGATEVVNNILALYMQDKYLGKMERVVNDIQLMPEFIEAEKGHVWGAGGAGERLVMFAQLKEWAETEFDISKWYEGTVPAYYETSITGMKGWNLFKLMHRLTRNESESGLKLNGINHCYGQTLEKSDALMLCASYAAQTDLTEFFSAWNPGVVAQILPGQDKPEYKGGVSQPGKTAVSNLNLPIPKRDPLKISEVTVRSL